MTYIRTTYDAARGIVDSEYEVLVDMTKQDLWEYLSSIFSDLTKEDSDKIWMTMLG